MLKVIHADTDGISVVWDEKRLTLVASSPDQLFDFKTLILNVEDGSLVVEMNEFEDGNHPFAQGMENLINGR